MGMEPEKVGLAQDDPGGHLGSGQQNAAGQRPQESLESGKAVRVMVRLLQQADSLGSTIPSHDHCRAAKKRARVIEYTRGRPKRVQHYRALLRIARIMDISSI